MSKHSDELSQMATKILPQMQAGSTLSNILDAVHNPDINAWALAEYFEQNPFYEHFLMKADFLKKKVAEWSEESKQSEEKKFLIKRTLGLLGKQATRNLVATVRTNRVTFNQIARLKKDKTMILPTERIKLALRTQEYCETNNLMHSDHAFSAALHFDFLVNAIAAQKGPKEIKTIIDTQWGQFIKTAHIAYNLSKLLKQVDFEAYVFSAGLLIHLGKLIMPIFHPRENTELSWAGFITESDKLKQRAPLFIMAKELSLFGITHAEWSRYLVQSFGVFAKVAPAIRYYQWPAQAKSFGSKATPKDQFVLATILSAANHMRYGLGWGQLLAEQKAALTEIGINEKQVQDVLGSVK